MALTKIITDTIDLSSDTTGLKMPKGTTAERQIQYLVVAGGGGGASNSNGGGGGGAGGLLSGTTDMIAATNLTITVGDGGTGAQDETSDGGDGDDSVFGNITATGGGGGGESQQDGRSGGSGGGASGDASSPYAIPGSGIPQQGNNGGTGGNPTDVGGGGGGAGGVGQSGGAHNSSTDGQGGAALSNSITGTAVNYAGGGGGGVCDFVDNGSHTGQGQAVGSNADGNGGVSQAGVDNYMNGDNGTTNTGSGGGGGSRSAGGTTATGGDGGSGIVILRYASKYTLVNNGDGTLITGVLNGTVGDDKYTTFTAGTGTISGLSFDLEIGAMRENTTTGKMEIYTGAKGWRALQQTGQDVGVVPSNNFNTVLWTSTGNTDISITGVGFKPDLVWAKSRSDAYSHTLYDSVRGAGSNHWLASNGNWTESTLATSAAQYGYLGSFNDDGFTGNAGTTDNSYFNYNTGKNYVAWSWKAGGAATTIGAGTVGNDIASEVSVNTATGFSIVKYTATLLSSGNLDVAHGLGTPPEIIISKSLTTTAAWRVRPFFLNNSAYNYLELNNTNAIADLPISDGTMAMPTANVFSNNWNGSVGGAADIIAYCWHSVPGYSLIGSYTGTGSATNTPIIYTGFEPAWIMVKRTDSTSWWNIQDNKRNTSNPRINVLGANDASAEIYSSAYAINFYNNGFQIANSFGDWNAAGGDYIFMCFAS